MRRRARLFARWLPAEAAREWFLPSLSDLEVTWATLPMLGILAIGVLLITYVPWLTTGILEMIGRM